MTKLRCPVVKLTKSVASYCDDMLEISSLVFMTWLFWCSWNISFYRCTL